MEASAQGDYIGESISQLEHSLQCAHLAMKAGELSYTLSDRAPALPTLLHCPPAKTVNV